MPEGGDTRRLVAEQDRLEVILDELDDAGVGYALWGHGPDRASSLCEPCLGDGEEHGPDLTTFG